MAGIDYVADIASSVPFHFATQGVQAWNEACPLLSLADIEFEFTGSDAVSWSIGFSGTQGGFVSEGSDVNNSLELGVKDRTKAQLNRAIARTGFGLTHSEMAVVATLKSDITADFVIERLRDAWLEALSYECRLIEVQLAIGNGTAVDNSVGSGSTNGIFGVIQAILSVNSGGNYAGLTNSYGAWNPTVVDGGHGTLTQNMLDKVIAGLHSNANVFPKACMMSPNSFVQFKEQLGDSIVRLWSGTGQPADYTLGVKNMANSVMPLPVASYDGIDIFVNSAWAGTTADATQAGLDGYALFFRPEDMALNILPYMSWIDAVLNEKRQGNESYANVVKKLGLPFYTYSLFKSGATTKVAMELEFQLRLKSLNRFGLLKNFAT